MAIDLGSNSPIIICRLVSSSNILVTAMEWAVGIARPPIRDRIGVNWEASTFCPYAPSSKEVAVIPT